MNVLFMIVMIICLLMSTGALLLSIHNAIAPEGFYQRVEINHDEELNKAVELIEEYCLTRSEKERCRFNMSDNDEECVCMLLKTPPEGWNNADNTRKPQ